MESIVRETRGLKEHGVVAVEQAGVGLVARSAGLGGGYGQR